MEWLAIVGVITSVLLGAAVAVLSAMLKSAHKVRMPQASSAALQPAKLPPVAAGLPGARQIDAAHLESDFTQSVNGGEVFLFHMVLENDRLSPVSLSGFRRPGAPTTLRLESAIERIHEDDRSMFRNTLIDAITRQRPVELVFRMVWDDVVHHFHLRAKTYSGANQGSTVLAGAVVEISSLMVAQREQDEWLKTLEELEDTLPFGMWAFDAGGVMTVWNRAAGQMTGVPPEDVVGFDLQSIGNPTFAAVLRGAEDALSEGVYRAGITTPEGTRHLRITKVRIRRDGHVTHTFGIMAEEGQTTGGGKSGEMEALGRLTAEVAHDFANLVHIIMGYADIVAQDLGDNERLLPPFLMDDVGQIQNAASRADELVRQILVFCSRESQNNTTCDLNDLVKRFMGLMTRILGENINLRFHPRPDLQSALADPGMVERVLLKLLLRLKDTMPESGVVAMSTMNVSIEADWPVGDLEPADYVKLSVSTDTIGWGGEPLEEEGNRDAESVTGLLAASGGHLNLHESPDLGTTVSLYFRSAGAVVARTAAPEQSDPPRSDQPCTPAADSHGTILVVEDDTPVRRLTAKALTTAGHLVLEAADGPEAISIFNADPDRIDLLITDVIMPGMNGRQVCDELKRVRPDLPVLFCSGYSSDLLRNEYMLNIQGLVIQKPYRSSDLVAAAARLLAASPARVHGTAGDAEDNSSL